MSGLDPKKYKLTWQFMSVMGELMSKGNDDGLGYAAVDKDGNLFGERWLINDEAFTERKKQKEFTEAVKANRSLTSSLKDKFKSLMDLDDEEQDQEAVRKYGVFGNVTPEVTAVTLHTRMATTPVRYENVHPFVDEERSISVIHNGVIRNHTKADEIRSTCDSERILNKFIDHEINLVPADVQNFVDELKGYMACGIFSINGEGTRVLDVFKSKASVAAAHVKELNVVVFSTSLDDIKKACRILNLTITAKADRIKEDVFTRFNAITGEIILTQNYKDTLAQGEYLTTDYNRSHTRGDDDWSGMEGHGRYLGAHNSHSGYTKNEKTGIWESAKEKWDREKREKALEDAKKSDNVIQLPNKSSSQTEATNQASAEMARAGLTQDEINESLKRQGLVDTVASEVAETVETVANVSDPLNENEAAASDFYMNRDAGLWIKRMKH